MSLIKLKKLIPGPLPGGTSPHGNSPPPLKEKFKEICHQQPSISISFYCKLSAVEMYKPSNESDGVRKRPRKKAMHKMLYVQIYTSSNKKFRRHTFEFSKRTYCKERYGIILDIRIMEVSLDKVNQKSARRD